MLRNIRGMNVNIGKLKEMWGNGLFLFSEYRGFVSHPIDTEIYKRFSNRKKIQSAS